jgi:RHS repeat-associated protein
MHQNYIKYNAKTPPKYPQSFTGKERDSETGFSYFGARYYDSDILTGWLSVDPMADKYPGLSPYAYCALNPIRVVDPNGDSILLKGEKGAIQYALKDMQKRTKNLQFRINDKGYLLYEGHAKTDEEKYIQKIITDSYVISEITLQTNEEIRKYNARTSEGGGSFLGNSLEIMNDGKKKARAEQVINIIPMRDIDPKSANIIWHEISESYEGGLISLQRNKSCNINDMKNFKDVYQQSHNNANYYFCANIFAFGFSNEKKYLL